MAHQQTSERTPEQWEDDAAFHTAEAGKLIDWYQGVRPSWVSADIAAAKSRAAYCRARAADLRGGAA